jgi:hypothetical protein
MRIGWEALGHHDYGGRPSAPASDPTIFFPWKNAGRTTLSFGMLQGNDGAIEPCLKAETISPREKGSSRSMSRLMPSEGRLESVSWRRPWYGAAAAGQGVSRLVTSWLSNSQTSGWGFEPGGGMLWSGCLAGCRRWPTPPIRPRSLYHGTLSFLSTTVHIIRETVTPEDTPDRVHPGSDVGHERSASWRGGHRHNLQRHGQLMTTRTVRR